MSSIDLCFCLVFGGDDDGEWREISCVVLCELNTFKSTNAPVRQMSQVVQIRNIKRKLLEK